MSSPSATNATPSAGSSSSSAAAPSQGFPSSRRLLKRSEFQKVYEQGARAFGPLFALFLLQSATGAPARVGLTVSRKVGKAVMRNRVKRLLREASRRHWDWFPTGAWVVLQARNGIREAGLADIESELQRCIQKAASRPAAPRREPAAP